MKTQKTWYLLPFFPAAALIVGQFMVRWFPERWYKKTQLILAGFTVIATCVLQFSDIRLSSYRSMDYKLFAKKLSDEGKKFQGTGLLYNQTLHEVNNPLLFYTDLKTQWVTNNSSVFADNFNSKKTFGVMSVHDFKKIMGSLKNMKYIRGKDLVFIYN